jgi:peptidoglycan/LPS O-acetylase OafA/YrhL
MPATSPSLHRNNGLDTLRAAAIILVFMYHYMVFVSRTPTFGWLSTIGWVGVDLFFVLSGYLIANQLFARLARGEPLSATNFYARRALRTLPVFWLVLAAYFLWPAEMGGKTPPPLWRFLTFTQNIGLQPGTAFSHAWSLCIEEQFYLVLPLILILGVRWRSTVKQGWTLIAALFALGIGARAVLWSQFGREADGQMEHYYPWVYYATLCRFDEFLPGVAVAMVKNFHPQTWQQMMQRGQHFLIAGSIATLLMLTIAFHFYFINNVGYGMFMSVFGYTLIAAAFALLVVAALAPQTALHRLRVPGAAQIALWSYAIYLSHKPIAHMLNVQGKSLGASSAEILAVICIVCVIAGWLIHVAIEAPFLRLRDRYFPLRRAGTAASANTETGALAQRP